MNYTVCILRYSRRFEGKISDLVDSESGGSDPHFKKSGSGHLRLSKITPMCNAAMTLPAKVPLSCGITEYT